MLWTVFVVLLILWLLGFSLHVGGGPILLIVGSVVLVILSSASNSALKISSWHLNPASSEC